MSLRDRLAPTARYLTGVGLDRNLGGPGRALRFVLGGGLIAAAVATYLGSAAVGLGAVAFALLAGGYLVWQAQTQYCPVNHALGRDTTGGETTAADHAGDR
jgi:hypothetical protein